MVIEFYLVFFERKKVFYNAVCFNNFLYNNAPITDLEDFDPYSVNEL